MPSARFMNAQTLVPSVKNGTVKEATIDDKLVRLFRLALRYHWLDRPQLDTASSTYSVADRAVALKGALESITLLKNENHVLPLDTSKVKTIAIVGPDAWPAVVGGGGSSQAEAFQPVSILTGIANLLGPDTHVLYARGLPDMTDIFGHTHWEPGVKQATYSSKNFAGDASNETVREINNYKQEWWGPADKTPRSIRYTASFKASKAGKYLVLAAASGSDHYTVSADGKQIIEQKQVEGQHPESATIELGASQVANFVADYLPGFQGNRFALGVVNEEDMISADAKKFASVADVAVLAVGFNPSSESEGFDRSFALPWGQDALVEAIAAANPHTIVTFIGGGSFDTQRWLDKVPALVHAWYPGQEGGTAIADVLFGKHNPEGKLPVSFDRSWQDDPSYLYYYPLKGADTKLHVVENNHPPADLNIQHVKYDDKLMVGYRYWTTSGKQPLFPFGFGLSYTTFSLANLHVPETATSGTNISVSFDVTNTGSVEGAEVAQLYVSDPSAKVKRPERELKGFAKVTLAPGQTRSVTIPLDARSFSYWDESKHNWTIDPGKFTILVGDSSENTPLHADLTIQ
jgi:beta-glucosidase